MIKLILFLLSLHAMKNVRAANIDDSVTIGKGTNIDSSVVIKAKSQIGNFVKIAAQTQIGKYCRVGDHVEIGEHCTIANEVKIGNRVRVNEKASISNGVEIGDDSLIDEYSKTSHNVKIAPNAYIGRSASVSANVVVNEYAILHGGANIPSDYTVKNNEIVINSPRPVQLHKNCAPIKSISNDQLQIANDNSSAPSKAFNDMLRGLLDVQINVVREKCEKGNAITQPNLSIVKTLYSIQRYGLERFIEVYKTVNSIWEHWEIWGDGTEVINGLRIPPAFHFGENEDNNILEPDVKKKFIQLLEIEEDSNRKNRVKNDLFCSVTAQVLNGERDITVTDPNHKSFANNNSINIVLILAMVFINVYSLFFVVF